MWNTIAGSILTIGGDYDYREGVSVWYRSFLAFQPDAELMAEAPLGFQLHALVAFGLFALWPFTRLVHVFSAPLGYLTRPYIVYRSRDDASSAATARAAAGTGSADASRPAPPPDRPTRTRGDTHAEGVTDRAGPRTTWRRRATRVQRAQRPHDLRRSRARAAPDPDRAARRVEASTSTRTRGRPRSRSCTAASPSSPATTAGTAHRATC